MQYFFQLGSQSDLCYDELLTCLDANFSCKFEVNRIQENIAIVEPKTDSDIQGKMFWMFEKLGGSIRFGVMIEDTDQFLDLMAKRAKNRIPFGVNSFGVFKNMKELDKFVRGIKEKYVADGKSVRFLLPKIKNRGQYLLNSAQVSKNKLIEKGFELNLISVGDDIRTAQTLAIQDYEQFRIIDFEKPRSDRQMGMLPPKLARIMVNLAGMPFGKEKVVWDPFCGSGGILLQALLTGRSILGSDIDKWAVRNSEQNIEWMVQMHPEFADFSDVRYKLFDLDITDIPKTMYKVMKNSKIDAVVCEPYMGPPQKRAMARRKAFALAKDTAKQYQALFDFLTYVGKDGLKAVIVVPSYRTHYGWHTFFVNDLISQKKWKIVKKNLHWERKTSIIRRNIMVLELRK